MSQPINQEHEDVLNFAHSLPSGLTKEQIYVRIHERARAIPPAAAAAGLPADQGDIEAGAVSFVHVGAAWALTTKTGDVLAYGVGDQINAPALPADPVDESQPAAQWISVDERLPPVGEPVFVFSPPSRHDWPGAIRIGIDNIDPNDDDHASWQGHNNEYEHYCCVAKPEGSTGPAEKAPYTHWMPLPSAPAMEAQRHE